MAGTVRILLVEDDARFREAERHVQAHVVREIDDGGAGVRIPTLVLTANLDPTVAARAMDAGARGALSKVVTVPATVEAIRRLTDAEP